MLVGYGCVPNASSWLLASSFSLLLAESNDPVSSRKKLEASS
jgi:hypothetical protein